jgi:hypothetical protein
MWFCVVLVLAVGWGGHFRYSRWLEENLMRYRPPDATVEEMKVALNDERQEAWKWQQENARLNHAIGKVLTREQSEAVEQAKVNWQSEVGSWPAGGSFSP